MAARQQKLIVPNPRVMVVHSLTELANAKFGPANLIKFPRELTGDFNGLARKLGAFLFALPDAQGKEHFMRLDHSLAHVSYNELAILEENGLKLTPEERCASDEILADLRFANQRTGVEASLRVVGYKGYPAGAKAIHTDGYPEDVETVLEERKTNKDFQSDYDWGGLGCCYNMPVTQSLLNEDVEYAGDGVFRRLKRAPFREDISPGDLFRHAAFSLEGSYLPFVHRVPPEIKPEDPPRLLLR